MTEREFTSRAMQATEADLALFKRCFDANDSPRTMERVRWQYAENPTGVMMADFTIHAASGALAAIYATLPCFLRTPGGVVLGVQSLDTLTDQAFRGRGLFTTTAAGVYERAARAGASLVFGFPSQPSAPGCFGKLRWTNLDPVPYLVRPLRVGAVTKRVRPLRPLTGGFLDRGLVGRREPRLAAGEELRPVERFAADADRLWQVFARDIRFAVERDARYLNWRILDKPGVSYRTVGFWRDGRLAGFAAYALRDKWGGRLGYVLEVLHDPAEPRTGALLLREALRRMLGEGCEAAIAWCFSHSPNRAAYRRAGFLGLPRRFWPIELHFGARGLAMDSSAGWGRREGWYISYCDSDTV